jgi:hypothetical protein
MQRVVALFAFAVLAIGLGTALAFDRDWFNENLRALQELPLDATASGDIVATYRLVLMPSFAPPFSARVAVERDGRARVFLRMSDGQGGYDPGNLAFKRVVVIASADVQSLEAALVRIDFWKQPLTSRPTAEVRPDGVQVVTVCADGTNVVFEAAVGGKYHLVERHCVQVEHLLPALDAFKRIVGPYWPSSGGQYFEGTR